jgi:hypothetical protein
MKWVTRERPKIDRIACPWLIRRFIDKDPEFLFVPAPHVLAVATQTGAIPYDVPDVELTHVGELCSFDAFLQRYQLTDRALTQLAVIVRGADTGRPDLAPQAAGLLAVSLGLSARFTFCSACAARPTVGSAFHSAGWRSTENTALLRRPCERELL